MKVLVIGAGIIGTSSALKIQEAWPECHIEIVTESLSPGTTSDGAAGFWQPHLDPNTPTDLARKWSAETFRELEQIWTCPRACPASLKPLSKALSLVPAEEIWNRNCTDAIKARPYWADIVYDYHIMPLEDLSRRGFDTEVFDSHSFTTFVFEAKIALPIMYSLLRERGATFIEKKLLSKDDLEQLMEEEGANYDFVINCSGSGARELFDDEDMQPIRGHVVRVEAPFVHTMMGLGADVYIIPTRQGVVLGSVDRVNDWSLKPDPSEVTTIMKRCQELCPALAEAKILNNWVGLRPFRKSGVRLELVEHQSTSGRKTNIIHNYGHGGSGITLSLGCANEVVRIVKAHINMES